MNGIWISLLPLILGSALVPVQIILVIFLLKSPQQGLAKGLMFVSGMTAARLLQGWLFGLVFSFGSDTTGAGGKGPIVATLLLVLGLLLLISAYRAWSKEPDPDAPPPRWMARLDQATPVTALAMGAALPLISPKLWVFLLGALEVIDLAQLGQPASLGLFLLYILGAQALLLLPILVRLFLPARSAAFLAGVSTWLDRNGRTIKIAVSLVFGLWFFYQGVSSFLP